MLKENINVIRLKICYFTNIVGTAIKACSGLLGGHVEAKFGSQDYLVTKIPHGCTQQLLIVTRSISV